MSTWVPSPSVDIDYARPSPERYRVFDGPLLGGSEALLADIRSQAPSWAPWFARLVAVRLGGRFREEFRGLGEATAHDWRWLVVANVSYDFVIKCFCCTTAALPTPAGPVLARNMDWAPEAPLAEASVAIRYVRGGALRYVSAGWPGIVGAVTGMSANGFAFAINAVSWPGGVDWRGYPVLLFLRRLLEEAGGFDDAVQRVSKARLFAAGLITLVGTANHQRVCCECAPKHDAVLRWGEAGRPLLTTNDYQHREVSASSEITGLTESACGRRDALAAYLEPIYAGRGHGDPPTLADDQLLYGLQDPGVIQGITAQHVIARPASQGFGLWVPRRLLA